MRRSAISIPSNIAEGHSRHGTRDYINFISIAIGSSNELETQVILSQDLGFIAEYDATLILKEIDQLQKMLHKICSSLKEKL
jgi:four helix bundle protein